MTVAVRSRLARAVLASALLAALLSAQTCAAQDDSRLKAAFIFNIAQFTTWPPGPPGPARVLAICASPAHSVWPGLRELEGKALDGRALTVVDSGTGRSCDVMVYSASAAPAVAPVAVPGMLTIVDGARRGHYQGAVTLVEEDPHLRFDIDTREAARAGLKFSSRLLQLARNVL
ncbi:YfiR family protein [Pseudoduganella chitinolytica]|uniref:YfiR family protein n=1 Tax=Pseudoduganella chitinolytica TaxID=34070 RepID=A0ABY8BIC3_9BURK|nr:YfiR family protein [Pseudoduganella chitinolytica]WEF35108.1 YfiR family protein [Pseudoduganella chitinolytica]